MNEQIDLTVSIEAHELATKNLSSAEQLEMNTVLKLGCIGANRAATALSQVLGQPVTVEVPKIHVSQAHLIAKILHKQDMSTTAVYMQLNDKYGCDILLAFESEEAKKIAALMSCAASIDELDPTLATSAINELANIVIGAFLSAVSDMIGTNLFPTPPQAFEDTFDAIIQGFLVNQSIDREKTLVFETQFKQGTEDVKCALMLFPSEELKELLVKNPTFTPQCDTSY